MTHSPEPQQPTNSLDDEQGPALVADSELRSSLSAILDEYLTMLEAGVAIDDSRFLASHDEFAEELRPHLESLRAMHVAFDAVGELGSNEKSLTAVPYEAPKKLGAYTLIREVGRGGQGIVYEAKDETLNRRVALKVLPFAAVLDRKQIERFNNEAQAAARLHHPNIVPVYAVGVDRGVHYYAMQFVEGAPLSVAIAQLVEDRDVHGDNGAQSTVRNRLRGTTADQSLPTPSASQATSKNIGSQDYVVDSRHFENVARLGIELAGALDHAHELGIVHRDIKPSNLLLDENGKPWVADFGLARIPNDSSMTATGDILGTIRYMSPEQAKGRNAFLDHRTDIYSLGVTLYELLTLQPVFASSTREEFLTQIGTKEPARLRRINSAIPNDLENIVLRAIEAEPADRYETAGQLREDLQRFLDGQPTLAKRAALSDRVFKWARRHRRAVTAAAACLLLMAVGFATATFMIARANTRTNASNQQLQTNLKAARQIVDQLGVQTSESLAGIPGTENVRQELLQKTKGYYDFLLAQPLDDFHNEAMLHDRGVTLTRSARITEQMGDLQAALKLYDDAAKELQSTIAKQPDNMAYRCELLNCWNNESMLLARLGRLEEAAAKLQSATSQQRDLLKATPKDRSVLFDLACSQSNLAFVLERSQQYDKSRQAYEAAIELFRSAPSESMSTAHRRQFALVLHNLSALLAHEDLDDAFKLCREAIAIQQSLVNGGHQPLGLKTELAISFDRLAELQMLHQETNAAKDSYRTAIAMQRELIALAPTNIGLREDLAITLNHLGDLFRGTEELPDAEKSFSEAAELLSTMIQMAPEQVAFRSSLGAVLYNQGSVLLQLEKQDAALRLWNEGLTHQQAAVKRAPSVKSFRDFLQKQRASFDEAFPEMAADTAPETKN